MVTKYDTGDKVLIEATIGSAQLNFGEIIYSIDELKACAENPEGTPIFIRERDIIAKSNSK